MDTKSFEELLSWVAPFIQKSSLRRLTATLQERLCVTLRYLCTGGSQITIGTSYRISPMTIERIILETCQAILYALNKKGFIKVLTLKKEWLDIPTEFDSKWNFPHCLGALDGKHIIQAPLRSGSTFFNYKKSFDTVLITSSHLSILVKLAGKVMEVSTTTVNYECQLIETCSIFQDLQL